MIVSMTDCLPKIAFSNTVSFDWKSQKVTSLNYQYRFSKAQMFFKKITITRNFQLIGVPSPDACLRLSPKLPRLGYLVLDSHYFLNRKFQIWYILIDELNFMPSKILFHNYCNWFLSWFFWPQVQIFLQIIPSFQSKRFLKFKFIFSAPKSKYLFRFIATKFPSWLVWLQVQMLV